MFNDAHEQTVAQIHAALRGARRVLIATHEHPDGDAIGSSLALLTALRLQGKQVVAYIPDPAPEQFLFLPGVAELSVQRPVVAEFDAVVVLDATYFGRTQLAAELAAHPLTITIDHHLDNAAEATINLLVPQAAATAQILTAFFAATNTPITSDMATCLLTGIFTDTGSFMHDSTTPEILKLAAQLMKKGARLSHIAHETYQKKDLPSLRVWGRALSRIVIDQTTGVALSVITAQDLTECGATLDDLAGVVNMLNTLPEAKFALLLTEYEPGKIKGSLRSEPHKDVDVSAIAKRLGGGGHKLAAGFEVPGHIHRQEGMWRIVPAV
ncbi:MAG TPA: bifunctional oligoribonuclease/PAP phosphatase NrnA [Candidatus Andersenbacteria bacterium]|nr:bifunctional oligoribonuclease/PAP phosphatase NrnA [Candidatus Andersenbacteria bacterium]